MTRHTVQARSEERTGRFCAFYETIAKLDSKRIDEVVSGLKKRRLAFSRAAASPMKRFTKLAGISSVATDGANRPATARQNWVVGN